MALLEFRDIKDSLLVLDDPEGSLFQNNHIFEPEFHQGKYVDICTQLSKKSTSKTIGNLEELIEYPHRGTQPKYADIETEPESLIYEGQLLDDGSYRTNGDDVNICALKSVSIRTGYIDFDNARSVNQEFYEKKKKKAGVQKNDVLINSTGDGTIGRVAVYNEDFPAVVDGHVTILRFNDPELAWYIGAFLLSDMGQRQIYRYINGSSGQVEIYPQDIARIWIDLPKKEQRKKVADSLLSANSQYKSFRENMRKSLRMI